MTDPPSIESLREDLERFYQGLYRPQHADDCPEWLPSSGYQRLRCAITELESLRRDHDALTALHIGTEAPLHSLRASDAALRAERDGLESELREALACNRTLAEDQRPLLDDLTAERARADALAARVEMMKQVGEEMLYQFSEPTFPGTECRQSGHVRLSTLNAWKAFFNSPPPADLEAHDAKGREPLEKRIAKLEGIIAKQRNDMLGSSVEAVREERNELKTQADDLSTLIRQLVHSLNKHNPGSGTAARAMDYLRRKGLQGSILRGAESQETHDARVRREAWVRVNSWAADNWSQTDLDASLPGIKKAILGSEARKETK